jgi:hypothetical protein
MAVTQVLWAYAFCHIRVRSKSNGGGML